MNKYVMSCLIIVSISCTPNKIFLEEGYQQLESTSYLQKISDTEESYIIDVRTPLEFNRGHVEGAINVSYVGFNFGRTVKKLNKNKTVFIYCQTAHRSPYAAKTLRKLGFTKVIDLKGGYKALKKET